MKPMKPFSAGVEKVIDVVTEIAAFFTVLLIVFMLINDVAHFLPTNIHDILAYVQKWAVLVIVGLAGMQFAIKRGFVIFLIYAALVAAAVILMFFPSVLPF